MKVVGFFQDEVRCRSGVISRMRRSTSEEVHKVSVTSIIKKLRDKSINLGSQGPINSNFKS